MELLSNQTNTVLYSALSVCLPIIRSEDEMGLAQNRFSMSPVFILFKSGGASGVVLSCLCCKLLVFYVLIGTRIYFSCLFYFGEI